MTAILLDLLVALIKVAGDVIKSDASDDDKIAGLKRATAALASEVASDRLIEEALRST